MKKVKRRFVPDQKETAVSLLNQAKRAMIAEKPLPPHVANYLLEVIYSITIDGEKSAQRAFGLTEKKGIPAKILRDTVFAWRVDEYRAQGKTRPDALVEAMREFPDINNEETADTAYRKGKEELRWMQEVDEFMGRDFSGEDIEKLKTKYLEQIKTTKQRPSRSHGM